MTGTPPPASVLRRLTAEGLGVGEPKPVAAGIEEIRRGLVEGAEAIPPARLPMAGLSALALGWPEGARDFLERAITEAPHLPASVLLLAARYGLWTGDLRGLSSLAEELREPAARVRQEGGADLLQDLARALEPGGASPTLTSLRDTGGEPPSTGRYAFQWPSVASLLAIPGGPDAEALTRPASLAALLQPTPPGSAGSILAPVALVHGLLRAEADAGYGRLHLGPRLPRAWDHLELRGLRMGDTSVELDYRAEAGAHRFLLRQQRGRVPLNLVFAPEVPWPEVDSGANGLRPAGAATRVRLNGDTADAEVTAAGPRVRVRLQVPLDRETEITVEGDGS